MSARSNMVEWDPYYPEQDTTVPPSPLRYQHNLVKEDHLRTVEDLLHLGRWDEKTSKQDEQNINTGLENKIPSLYSNQIESFLPSLWWYNVCLVMSSERMQTNGNGGNRSIKYI